VFYRHMLKTSAGKKKISWILKMEGGVRMGKCKNLKMSLL